MELIKNNWQKILLFFVIVLVAIWLSVSSVIPAIANEELMRFGYFGIFFAAIVSGFNVVVPIPVIAFTPVLVSLGFSFWLVVLVVSIGMTVGDGLGWLVGNMGRAVLESSSGESRFIQWVKKRGEKHSSIPLIVLFFYAALIPFPNEILVIPLSFLGYRFRSIFLAALLGNAIFNTLFALGISGIVTVI